MFCCCTNVQVIDTSQPEVPLTELELLELNIVKNNKLVKNIDTKTFLRKGGFGTVFIFTNAIANQKLIEKRGKLRHIKRTLIEAKTLIDLNGLFSPQFFLFEKIDTYTNLTMEYIHGEDLYEYFTSHQSEIDYEWIKHIISSISIALICIFNRGYMHLDLKLENVMYNHSTKKITLVDWGSCHRASNSLKRIKYCVGTKDYTAPEIFLGHYYHTSDIYSLGCIYWIFLTGKYPHDIKSKRLGFIQISEKFPPKINQELFDGLTNEQQNFLKCTLTKDCRKRITYAQLEKVKFINNYINDLNL